MKHISEKFENTSLTGMDLAILRVAFEQKLERAKNLYGDRFNEAYKLELRTLERLTEIEKQYIDEHHSL